MITVSSSARRREAGAPALQPHLRNSILLLLRVGAALAFIAALTFVLHRFLPVNAITVGLLYLVAVLFVATRGGIVESTAASVAAMLCFNFYFLPPIGTITIDPRSLMASYNIFIARRCSAVGSFL